MTPAQKQAILDAMAVFAPKAWSALSSKNRPNGFSRDHVAENAAYVELGETLAALVADGVSQTEINEVLRERVTIVQRRDFGAKKWYLALYNSAGGGGHRITTPEGIDWDAWQTYEQLSSEEFAARREARITAPKSLTEHADTMKRAADRLAKLKGTEDLVRELRAGAKDLKQKQRQWDEEG